jgi:hypothetical protein
VSNDLPFADLVSGDLAFRRETFQSHQVFVAKDFHNIKISSGISVFSENYNSLAKAVVVLPAALDFLLSLQTRWANSTSYLIRGI